MKKREAWNWVAHTGVALILVALVLVHRYFLLLDVFIWASLREQAQHRWIIHGGPVHVDEEKNLYYRIEKRTFFDFGWLGWKQAFEIGQWCMGVALGLIGYELFFA